MRLLTWFFAGIFALSTTAAQADVEKKDFDFAGIKTLKVENSSGETRVTLSANGQAHVAADKKGFGAKCQLTLKKDGSVLLVKNESTAYFGSDECRVDFAIQIPKGTVPNLEFTLGSGRFFSSSEVKDVNGRVGSGDIEIEGLRGPGTLKTGSGHVQLTYLKSPAPGEMEIKSGSGNAEVIVPKGTQLVTHFMAGSGQLQNQVGDTPDAPFKVSMSAGSGNLTIRAAK